MSGSDLDPYRQQPSSCCPAHLRPDTFLLNHPQYIDIARQPTTGEYAWTTAFPGTKTKRLICRPDELEGVQRSRTKEHKELSRCHVDCRPAHIYSLSKLSKSAGRHLRLLCPAAASAGHETLYFRSQSAQKDDDRKGFWARCLHCALGNLSGCPCEGRDMDDLTSPTLASVSSSAPPAPSSASTFSAAKSKAEQCDKRITAGVLKRAKLAGELAKTEAQIERDQAVYRGLLAQHPSLPPHTSIKDMMVKKGASEILSDGREMIRDAERSGPQIRTYARKRRASPAAEDTHERNTPQ